MKRGHYQLVTYVVGTIYFIVPFLGCMDREADSPPSPETTPSLETTPAAVEVPAAYQVPVSQLSLENTPVVPGTTVLLNSDDPAQDGWQSELFAAQVGDQLKHLMGFLPGSAEPTTGDLASVVAATVHCEPLRPMDLEVVYETPSLLVRRQAEPAKELSDTTAFAASLAQLLSAFESPRDVHGKVKVFRVDEGADAVEQTETRQSSAYVQFWGGCGGGAFQINATWRCGWKLSADGPPRLDSLHVLKYEEVLNRGSDANPTATRPTDASQQPAMFVDCTEAVLTDDTFRQQLLPGVDSWLGTIESRLGIDIGGWQGLSIADVNGDGLDDLYCCQPGGLPNRLYLQQLDGSCVEHSAAAGLDWLDSSHAAIFVDLDNDGDQDAVVGLSDGILILANDGQGFFSVRAAKILPAALPYSLSAADFDTDGDLDIYICCYNRRSGVNQHLLFARPVPYHDANNGGRNVLLRNDITSVDAEEWPFRYVTKQVDLDVNNRRFSYASAWEDYDNDGDMDLYVANDFGRNNLFRNDNGRFVEVAEQAGVEDISPGMSACWGDYNNDGLFDLYVSNMFSSAGNRIAFQGRFQPQAPAGTRAEFQRHARGNSLFQNIGDGSFRDVSEAANVILGRWAWGSRFMDLNGDGWQDLVVANGFITQADTGDL